MWILLGVSGFLFFGYIFFVAILNKWKTLPSISESWYLLNERSKNGGMLFTFWCFILAFLQVATLIELAKEAYQFVGFFTAAGLGFVGAAPAFKGRERRIHRIGAGVAALFSLLFTIFSGLFYIFALFAFFYIMLLLLEESVRKHYIFWAEFYCFASLFLVELILIG
jgi:hypothetical protein